MTIKLMGLRELEDEHNWTNVSQYLPSIALQSPETWRLSKVVQYWRTEPVNDYLGPDGALELLDGVHLVAAGKGCEGGRLLALDCGVELLLQQRVPCVHRGWLGHLVVSPRPLWDLLCGMESN